MSFSGKVVLVTGASSGIGAATAVLFAKEGAKVAIVGKNETKLNNVAKKIAQYGEPPLTIRANVANEQEAGTIVKRTVDHFGKLDVLVNNAGILRYCSATDPNAVEVFDEIMRTNLRSVVQLTNLAVPHLVASKGNIVNVSSVVSLLVGSNYSAYAVSKAALDHFTRCVALELAASGVRVNTVNPGPVRTDIAENSGVAGGDEAWEAVKKMTALGRGSEPEEIGDLILFVASDKAKGITGSAYFCDNGSLLKYNIQKVGT